MKFNSPFFQKISYWVPGFSFFITSFLFRFVSFSQTSYANGWDSYFYLIQIKALLEEGAMHSKDLSLIYPFMTFIQLITKDYVLTYKIAAATLAGTFSLLIYLLALKWSARKPVALLLGFITLYSPQLTYFSGQYPKNMLGVILFLAFLLSIHSKKSYVLVFLVILNFFGHRLTAVLSVTLGALYVLLKKKPAIAGLALLGMLTAFLFAGIFLPGILSMADLERFKDVIVPSPQFSPLSFLQSFESLSPYWMVEIISITALHLTALWIMVRSIVKKKTEPHLAAITLLSSLLLFPFFNWSMESMGYRLFLVYVLIAPLMFLYFRDFLTWRQSAVACIFLFVLSFFSFRSYDPVMQDPPYALYHRLSERVFEKIGKEQAELIIAHKALAEYITFHTGKDAMPWIPEYPIQKKKLWRLAADINEVQLNYYLKGEEDIFYKLSPHYFLLREETWKKVMRKIEEEQDHELQQRLDSWKNPSRIRPFYLLKNKK